MNELLELALVLSVIVLPLIYLAWRSKRPIEPVTRFHFVLYDKHGPISSEMFQLQGRFNGGDWVNINMEE